MNSDLTSDERALPAAAGAASTPHPVNKAARVNIPSSTSSSTTLPYFLRQTVSTTRHVYYAMPRCLSVSQSVCLSVCLFPIIL